MNSKPTGGYSGIRTRCFQSLRTGWQQGRRDFRFSTLPIATTTAWSSASHDVAGRFPPSGWMIKPFAESAMRAFSLLSRVSSFFALTTHQLMVR